MELIISRTGNTRCIYSEAIDLTTLGSIAICRASYVEPDALGQWYSDLSPVQGPTLGPFHLRSDALTTEVAWLKCHYLGNL